MFSLYHTYAVDKFYVMCTNEFKGMPAEMAMKLYKIKQFLCYFVEQMPKTMSGQLNDADKLNNFFDKILQVNFGQ
jgi:hypothetical protein